MTAGNGQRKIGIVLAAALWFAGAPVGAQTVLYENGPVFNSVGTGFGGADESVLQTSPPVGDQDFGTAHGPSPFDQRVADDFTVTDPGGWQIGAVILYAYQTNVSTVSTLTSVNLRIWDGVPGDPGSTVVFGDTSTNRLVSSTFSGVYRVSESTGGANNRAIMENRVAAAVTLAPGTYWLDWQTDGTLANDGPWAPPIVITGVGATGNARSYSNTGTWGPLEDSNSGNPKGLPFLIEGASDTTAAAIPALDDIGIVIFGCLLLTAAWWQLSRRVEVA
jgi:hypothetical protein